MSLSIIHQKTNFYFPYVRSLSLRRVSFNEIIHETRKNYSEYIFLKYRAKINNASGCRLIIKVKFIAIFSMVVAHNC